MPLIDAVPPIRGLVGHPRRKQDSLVADRGYDHVIYRDQVRQRRIVPAIARRGTLHGTVLGTYPWVVERGFVWLHGFNASASAGNDAQTYTKSSSNSPAASSPTDRSTHCVSRCEGLSGWCRRSQSTPNPEGPHSFKIPSR